KAGEITAKVSGEDDHGNPYSADDAADYTVHTTLPTAEITLDPIAGDGVLDHKEAGDGTGKIEVTGKVGKDVQPGDTVTLTIGGKEYTGKVGHDFTFKIPVPVQDLLKNDHVDAKVTTIDSAGNSASANTSGSYTLDVNQLIIDGNKDGDISGGVGDDVLIGDQGGTVKNFVDGKNYNIALVLDTSGSMLRNLDGQEIKGKVKGPSRLELLKDALTNLAKSLEDHDGEVNIHVVNFGGTVKGQQTFTKDQISDLINYINKLTATGGTNYEAAFKATEKWFADNAPKSTEDVKYENVTYFLTDGDPTQYGTGKNPSGPGNSTDYTTLEKSVDAFKGLSEKSDVHAIGIGREVNEDYLRFFDNTNVSGIGSEQFVVGREWVPTWAGGYWRDVTKTVSGPTGEALKVTQADQLKAALEGGSTSYDPAVVGADIIDATAGGDNIIFGDAINVQNLDWNVISGGKPGDVSDKGLDALKHYLFLLHGLDNQSDVTLNHIYDFIRENPDVFNVVGETQGGNDVITTGDGNDIIYAGGGNDIIHAGAGDDVIYAQSGTNLIVGGKGNDVMYSGSGDDTFAWLLGDEGTVDVPAHDVIYDFGTGSGSEFGSDVVDLSGMLKGSGISPDNLEHYLQVSFDSATNKTIMNINTKGDLDVDGGNANQIIELDGVDLVGAAGQSQADLINSLIQQGKLNIDL
ncbi:Ig-like domain-containing protein, partial [Paenalcaligenes sp. Me131]|uniref:Ig-like domain-containing protein n=1 Tax=Paenalcaligenes sp. Me131 TaxID=3392636 RepID=UPI003D2DD829